MSENKMLIDATHPEETRVVVLRGGRVEEFDYESAARKQLRGNIYLAKVTRVEPALQAAFVDYGGNRHGFLAFNEIHPDYYQIPIADRLALLEEEAAIEAEEEAEADARAERLAARRAHGQADAEEEHVHDDLEDHEDHDHAHEDGDDEGEPEDLHASEIGLASDAEDKEAQAPAGEPEAAEAASGGVEVEEHASAPAEKISEEEDAREAPADNASEADKDGGPKVIAMDMPRDAIISEERVSSGDSEPTSAEAEADQIARAPAGADDESFEGEADGDNDEANGSNDVETVVEHVGEGADALEELPSRPRRTRRSYKIQEVIKRRQVLLVQVVKEERGNKGAALTTYLSLAGRYTVLMPNTARGGGISRKITNPQDRKRLKAIAAELEVPEGMGLIIRTAGATRTKQEIRRDFEYLLRLWESVRELTLQSTAPSLVYEEGDLIKRSIRDLYNKDIDEIVVAGEEAHREAKSFMRMLMPSHAKNVTLYKGAEPLYTHYGIERQLNAMFSPFVTLRSGGYLVINQTEALVAIDVNSGRSTREFSIEETALHTNLEAAEEIARHLKLRDLAGLIVIDFIDMEEKRNNRAVERRLKEALRSDRARIQVGRISPFGLLEMSRQRLRTGMLEGSTSQCPHCQGTGIIRSTESIALAVLRALEDAVTSKQRGILIANTTAEVALYILNNKREFIIDMEARHGFPIMVQASEKMEGANFTIEKGPVPALTPAPRRAERAVKMDWALDENGEEVEAVAEAVEENGAEELGNTEEDGNRRKRRRRRRGRRNGERLAYEEGLAGDERVDEMHADVDEEAAPAESLESMEEEAEIEASEATEAASNGNGNGNGQGEGENTSERPSRRRRRGRRGGRRNRERNRAHELAAGEQNAEDAAEIPGLGPQPSILPPDEAPAPTFAMAPVEAEEVPETREAEPAVSAAPASPEHREPEQPAVPPDVPATPAEPAPADRRRAAAPAVSNGPRLQRVIVGPDRAVETDIDLTQEAGEQPVRRGWWQRKLLSSES